MILKPYTRDVAPGVPFAADDLEYDAAGWAYAPLQTRVSLDRNNQLGALKPIIGDNDGLSLASELQLSSSQPISGGGGRNKFKLCIDHADQWDLAFPEGWFQAKVDSAEGRLPPGFCVSEVVEDIGGSGCGDADVVLFSESASLWHGTYMSGGKIVLPPRHHLGVVYIYFAHEAPTGFGSDLLDRRMMDQFDYLASSNGEGSALWWNFLPSARHLVQDYLAFARPFADRQTLNPKP